MVPNRTGLDGPDCHNDTVYLPKHPLVLLFHRLLLLRRLQLLLLLQPLLLLLLHSYKACVYVLNGPPAHFTEVLGGTHRLPQLLSLQWRRWLWRRR